MVLRVPERTVHRAAHATLVTIYLRAVHQLLLADVVKQASLEEISTLNDPCRGKGPVRPADVLVLHWRNGTVLHPINGFDRSVGWVKSLSAELSFIDMIAHEEVPFGRRPVRESVMRDPARMWLRAELHDLMVDFGVLDQAQAVLLQRLIILVELGHVESELIIVRLDVPGEGRLCKHCYT